MEVAPNIVLNFHVGRQISTSVQSLRFSEMVSLIKVRDLNLPLKTLKDGFFQYLSLYYFQKYYLCMYISISIFLDVVA